MSDESPKPHPTPEAVPEPAHVEAVIDKVEGSVAAAAKTADSIAKSSSSNALAGLEEADKTILRLNKLLASPGGLSAFLSTLNYTLYILAYTQTKSASLSSLVHRLLTIFKPSPSPTKPPATVLVSPTTPASVPPLAALALLISKARTTLRLFGLFPLYAWLRTLSAGPKPGSDPVLHGIAVLQASSYTVYQALENIALLADSGVLSSTTIARISRGESSTKRVYTWAYRAWLGGILCDFVRLGREWQTEAQRRAVRERMAGEGRALAENQEAEDRKFDHGWWMEVLVAGAWLPMALHYSSDKGGVPGWNMGWMGVSGLVAGAGRVRGLWEATV